MSDVIKDAVRRLESLRDAGWPGEWVYEDETIIAGDGYRIFQHHPYERLTNPALTLAGDEPQAQAELVITLHRTIDAQLELLRLALKYGLLAEGQGSRFREAALDLANAIVGTKENI